MMRVLKIGVGSQIGAGLSGYVAEIGAAFIGARLGIVGDHIDNHAAYLAHWLKVLAEDKRAIFKAAALAQAAADMVLANAGDPTTRTKGSPAIDAELVEGAPVELTQRYEGLSEAVYLLRYDRHDAWELVHPNGLGFAFGRDELRGLRAQGIIKPWQPAPAKAPAPIAAKAAPAAPARQLELI